MKDKHVGVLEFCLETGVTPKQLFAAARRLLAQRDKEQKEG